MGNISYSFYLWHLPILFFLIYILLVNSIRIYFFFYLNVNLFSFTYKYINKSLVFNLEAIPIISSVLVFAISLSSLIYIRSYNDVLRSQLRNFVYGLNYLENNYNWNDRIIFTKKLKINEFKVYDYCLESSLNYKLNKFNLRTECHKHNNFKRIFFLFGDSHTAQFLPLLTNSNYVDNIYFLHFNNYNFPDSKTIDKLINNYESLFYYKH